MKPQPLPPEVVERELAGLPGWERAGEAIVKTFDRGGFDGSIAFVNAVAAAANAADHHPDLAVAWNRVTVTLSSHDAGGVTARDIRLAHTLEALG